MFDHAQYWLVASPEGHRYGIKRNPSGIIKGSIEGIDDPAVFGASTCTGDGTALFPKNRKVCFLTEQGDNGFFRRHISFGFDVPTFLTEDFNVLFGFFKNTTAEFSGFD